MSQTEQSWLAEGVKEIERVVKAAQIVKPEFVAVPWEKPGAYAIVRPGPAGSELKIETKLAGPAWHNERLDDPKQLIAFIKSMEKRNVKPEAGAVYIGETQITYVHSFEDRRDVATCPLTISKPWAWLSREQKPMTQKEIVRELRITFDGCLPRDSNLIQLLRKVVFTNDNKIDSTVQRGKEALGANIVREINGVNDFPEEFTLDVQVYENVLQKVQVRVALELWPLEARFEVLPFPNQIHNGKQETLDWLRDDIASTGVPTFIGARSTDSAN